jgi:archaellum component FlaC
MRIRWFLVGTIFLLVPCLLVGCGVAQEEYDAAVAALDTASEELHSVKVDLGGIQDELDTAQTELKTTKDKLAAKENELGSSQAELESTKTEVAESEESISSLQTDLQKAGDDIMTLQNLNTTLSEELILIQYPKLFESTDEFAEWIIEKKIATEMEDIDVTLRSFIIQVLALRDGYLLPVAIYERDGEIQVVNQAYVLYQDYMESWLFDITFHDGVFEAEGWQRGLPLLPIHPLPLD